MHSEFFKDINEPEESDAEDAGGSGTNVEDEEAEGNPDDLLISDELRQRAPASDTANPTSN